MSKSIILPIVFGVVALACYLSLNARVQTVKANFETERYDRLNKERALDIVIKRSRQLQDELSESKQKLSQAQSMANEGQSQTSELKTDLDAKKQEIEDLRMSIRQLQDKLNASQKALAAAQASAQVVTKQDNAPSITNAVPVAQ